MVFSVKRTLNSFVRGFHVLIEAFEGFRVASAGLDQDFGWTGLIPYLH